MIAATDADARANALLVRFDDDDNNRAIIDSKVGQETWKEGLLNCYQ